jgi:endoglucanase
LFSSFLPQIIAVNLSHPTKKFLMRIVTKWYLTATILLLSFNGYSQGFLKANNTKIVNGNNQEVLLRGIGLGGWMLQEPYMLGLSDVATNQTQIRSKIQALIGETNTTEFYNAWLGNHVRKVDVDSLKAWGFNSIRLPMHYNLFTLPIEQEPVPGQDTWLDKGFALTDSLLKWCKANQIYLILDMHAAPGGQGKDAAISDYDNSKPSLWQNVLNQQKTVNLWRKIAERYAGETWIGGYDLINETNWGFQNASGDPNGCGESANIPLRQLLVDITTAIRQVDNNHLLFIEGNCWANNYSGIFPLWDANMAVSFHKYWNYTTTATIQNFLNYRTQYNVPLWMGEGGENSNSWDRNAIELLEQNNIGWAWWPVKKLGLNCPLEVKVNPGFQNIITYWKGNGSQPAASTAFNSLMQLTEDVKLENCFYHKDYIDAMFRQVQTFATVPFKSHLATDIIYATDYDLGPNKAAYYDFDTANFSVSTGNYQAWNQGWKYRNDGVDIESCSDAITNGYNVGWTQDNEWLQYTVQVPATGLYDLVLRTAGGSGQILVKANSLAVLPAISVPSTGGYQSWQTTQVSNVNLTAGTNVIQLYIQAAGFNLNYFQFVLKFSLPVKLADFSGEKVKTENVLHWKTATEENNSHFNIQRSIDGSTFSTVGSVKTKAANGNSTAELKYSFTDIKPVQSINYYRLQQQDKDGRLSYGSVVKLDNTAGKKLTAFVTPNPVKDIAKVSIYSTVSQSAQVSLYSSEGRLVYSNKVLIQNNQQNIAIPMRQLQRGIYRLVIKGTVQTTVLSISKD